MEDNIEIRKGHLVHIYFGPDKVNRTKDRENTIPVWDMTFTSSSHQVA